MYLSLLLKVRRINQPLLIAHRGGALEAFENSFSAFRHALRVGADSIEADLRATKDGKIVVMHDASLRRTASVQGKVGAFTLGELRKFKLKNGEPIPTLQELLEFAKGKISLHLEMKEAGFEQNLVKVLQKNRMSKSVFVISFFPKILVTIHQLDPMIETGFIFAKPESESKCPDFCKLVLPQEKLLNAKTSKRLKQRGKAIHAWVVNDPDRAKQLRALGVAGIATDRPSKIALWDHVPTALKRKSAFGGQRRRLFRGKTF